MNSSFIILLIILSLFIIYLIYSQGESKQTPEIIIHHAPSSSTDLYPIAPSRIKYSNQDHYKNHKWNGVQRNPVCCRINHTNRNFYDFDIYP